MQRQKLLGRYELVAKGLFLKFAAPCLQERVIKGELTPGQFETVCKAVEHGQRLEEQLDTLFPVAIPAIIETSVKLGKVTNGIAVIDDVVVKDYFLNDHEEVVRQNVPEDERRLCRVLPAVIKAVDGDCAVVDDGFGPRTVKLDFIKPEDRVLGRKVYVHWLHACDVVGESVCAVTTN